MFSIVVHQKNKNQDYAEAILYIRLAIFLKKIDHIKCWGGCRLTKTYTLLVGYNLVPLLCKTIFGNKNKNKTTNKGTKFQTVRNARRK